MDAFSLLRYWRSNNGGVNGGANDVTTTANLRTSTIVTQTSDSDDNSADDNDHGPFFDLEFSLPNNDENNENGNGVVFGEEDEDESDGFDDDDDDVEDDSDLKFALLSGSSGGDNSSSNTAADVNVSVSPSDDLFFKGSFIPVSNNNQTTSLETNSKPLQSRVSLVKHATKFRVMMLKLKKSKSSQSTEEEEQKKKEDKDLENVDSGLGSGSGKSMTTTVKFKIAEVPIVSLFKRDNSSKKAQKKRQNDDESVTNSSDEKKFSKEAMQKYLRKVKPLYVRVSKKYGDKLKSPSLEAELRKQLTVTESRKRSPTAESNVEGCEPPLLSSNGKGLIQGNLPAGLRVVCKHLGKSRSGSTAVVAAAPATITSKRRDDSLLQQQDGIQSAIMHCKRSFKASRDSDCSSSLPSDSVPTNGKSAAEDKEEMSKR